MADENQVVDAALEDAPVQVEEATETTAEVVEEVVEVETSVASLFEGEDLSEEFKNKMSIVFEAAVNEAVVISFLGHYGFQTKFQINQKLLFHTSPHNSKFL